MRPAFCGTMGGGRKRGLGCQAQVTASGGSITGGVPRPGTAPGHGSPMHKLGTSCIALRRPSCSRWVAVGASVEMFHNPSDLCH